MAMKVSRSVRLTAEQWAAVCAGLRTIEHLGVVDGKSTRQIREARRAIYEELELPWQE